jgi:hypothetical protein
VSVWLPGPWDNRPTPHLYEHYLSLPILAAALPRTPQSYHRSVINNVFSSVNMASDLDKRYLRWTNLELKGQIEFFSWPQTPPRQIPAEMLHELSIVDKEILFRDFKPVQAAQKAKGEVLLRRLNELAPSVAKNYELNPDLIQEFTMRLINGEKSPERSYIALSYCWAENSQYTPALHYQHGQDGKITMPISGLLFQAVIGERMMADEGLWIDQVCIDQTNKVEKNISIPAMAALYKHARVVLVALEDVEVDDTEQKFLRKFIPEFENSGTILLERPHFREAPAYMEKYLVFRGFFNKICRSRWFTRAWCSHEMRLGQKHIFYMRCTETGSHNANTVLGFSGEFLSYMHSLASETHTGPGVVLEVQHTIASVFDLEKQKDKIRRILDDQPGDLENVESYTTHIRQVLRLGAGGDPDLPNELRLCDANCDKISIVLNVMGNGLNLKRSQDGESLKRFASQDECYRQLMILALAAGDPLALCALRKPLRIGTNGCSWLCHLGGGDTGSAPESTPLPLLSSPSIKIDESPSARWIELDGLVLRWGEVPSKVYIDTAESVVQRSLKINLGQTERNSGGFFVTLMTWGVGPGYENWRLQTELSHLPEKKQGFIMTVASVLYCGMRVRMIGFLKFFVHCF